MWHCPFKGMCKSFKKCFREIESPGYEDPRGAMLWQIIFLLTTVLASWETVIEKICELRNWLPVSDTTGEIDSPGYQTPGKIRKIRITRRYLNKNWKYFNPLALGPCPKLVWMWSSLLTFEPTLHRGTGSLTMLPGLRLGIGQVLHVQCTCTMPRAQKWAAKGSTVST